MEISDLQISKANWHAGLTEATHLRNFFLVEPEMASQVVTRVYNMQNGYKNALSFLTGGMGKAKEMNDIIYRWSVMGDSRKAIPITRAIFDGVAASTCNSFSRAFCFSFRDSFFAFGAFSSSGVFDSTLTNSFFLGRRELMRSSEKPT